ncbi:hypothetical protein [Rothia sp. HMSC076D04]|uniref:hypothetical protein n=1 Tax=Rothia sp. HMSC076D04 TaxID=1739484 RepID=UPI001FEFD9BD|nr:hypothetical protein [Rothia sp. HMSC076D04]
MGKVRHLRVARFRIFTNHTKREPTMRTFLTVFWGVDAFGALVRVEYFDSAQPENAWVKVLVTDEGARVRAVCVYSVQDEAKADSQSAEFASAVEDAQAWLPQCPESVEVEGVTLVPVSTSVFSYDGNDSRLLQVSSDGSGSSLNYGAAGFVNSVASWGSAEDSAVSFSLLCASTDGRVLAAGGAPAGVPEFGVPSTGAGAATGSVAGFDASVMHPLVWDENSFVPRVLGVGGSSMPSVGSLVPGAGSGAGLLDPYGWASLGVVAPAVPSAQGAPAGGVPVLPDSLVGVSAASGVVLGSTGFEVLGARVVDSRVARFTAPDPLVAPVGAGWGADPFSLVGGNPVSLVDPWGLSPVSVEEFEKQKAVAASVRNVLEYVAGGAMVIAGAVIGAVGAGTGPLGGAVLGGLSGALMGAGMSVLEQKVKGERVDWSKAGQEAVKGGITGAVTGALTGGLGNLKKIADAASKMTKIEKAAEAAKATRLAQKAAEAGALASKWHKVKTAITPYAHEFGMGLKESRVLEDIVKDTVSGGINSAVSYYMDDNVKNKSVMGGVEMFFSGAGGSMASAGASGMMKRKMGVTGYAGDLKRMGIRGRATDVAATTFADTAGGIFKSGVQYSTETHMKGEEYKIDKLIGKIADNMRKDAVKSAVKSSVKMDADVAQKYRDRGQWYAFRAAEIANNPVGAAERGLDNIAQRMAGPMFNRLIDRN